MERRGYIVGVHLSPDRDDPDLYTVWYELEDDDHNQVIKVDGQILWATTLAGCERDVVPHLPPGVSLVPGLDGVCDVVDTLHDIADERGGGEGSVLTSLGLLDDFVFSTGYRGTSDAMPALHLLGRELLRGTSLPKAVSLVGGQELVTEGIFESLGRVLVFSSFSPNRS